jgi:hypothetical protein
MQKGMRAYNDHLYLPTDRRFDIVYAALTMGGKKGSAFAEGLTRSGKSQFGVDVVGPDNTVGVTKQDTVATLEGFESPTNPGEFIKGKININDPNDVIVNFDEVNHMKSSGDLHGWWTGDTKIMPDGTRVNLEDRVTFASGNYADGIRAFEIDSAMRSRLGLYLVSGDVDIETAKKINRMAERQNPLPEEFSGGLLPGAKTRRAIREYMNDIAPASDETVDFATEVINSLNNSGLVNPNDVDLSNTDAIAGWMHAARARRLAGLRRNEEGIPVLKGEITPQELIKTAPLALGSLATLSFTVVGELETNLGYEAERIMSDIERAIFTNRAIALIAINHLINPEGARVNNESAKKVLESHIAKYSYANLLEGAPKKIDRVMIDKLIGVSKEDHDQQEKSSRKRIRDVFSRR